MTTSSVDPTAEIAAIVARLDALTGVTYQGIPQGLVLPRDAFSRKEPYRDFEAGSPLRTNAGRMLGAAEQSQPYIWSFQVHHVAPTRTQATALAIETDKSLIGFEPSTNASAISVFYFSMYDEFDEHGEIVQWIASRFYETTLGMSPDL